jgi:hypothetical protein
MEYLNFFNMIQIVSDALTSPQITCPTPATCLTEIHPALACNVQRERERSVPWEPVALRLPIVPAMTTAVRRDVKVA